MSSLFTTHHAFMLDDKGLTVGAVITTHSPRFDLIANLVELYELDPAYRDIYHGEGVCIATRDIP